MSKAVLELLGAGEVSLRRLGDPNPVYRAESHFLPKVTSSAWVPRP